jgi:hypothetical protein
MARRRALMTAVRLASKKMMGATYTLPHLLMGATWVPPFAGMPSIGCRPMSTLGKSPKKKALQNKR